MMPRDTNPHGTIFGGVILSYIDQAGAVGAYHEIREAGYGKKSIVTVHEERRISPPRFCRRRGEFLDTIDSAGKDIDHNPRRGRGRAKRDPGKTDAGDRDLCGDPIERGAASSRTDRG